MLVNIKWHLSAGTHNTNKMYGGYKFPLPFCFNVPNVVFVEKRFDSNQKNVKTWWFWGW